MSTTHQRVALITGGNRGLGLQTAKELGSQGIILLIGARSLAKGEAAAKELRKNGFEAEAIRLEVTDPATHAKAYKHIESLYGRLDILVNNAGVEKEGVEFGTPGGFNTTSTVSQDVLKETFDINFFAVVALTQTLLPLIRKSSAGRIVNLSSILGSLTFHSDPSSPIYERKAFAYDATKTAINAFTVHLAAELRNTPIKVNSAHPGWVKTELGGSGASLEITEGGKTSAWLATLPEDGPTGGYFHLGQPLPW
jgi:NAD(P)-dependent dehydrogenase (short-subunit alcohol dehydrogenase family)